LAKKRVKSGRRGKKTDEASECVVPGDPIPPELVATYSPVRDQHRERDIAQYIEGQAKDETVKHVEKVKEEFVMGERYEVWDVTTDKGRWWVVTNPTNLYSQAHFQSLDYTLSFNIGLMMRVQSRQVRSGSPILSKRFSADRSRRRIGSIEPWKQRTTKPSACS
jgi:hypothetical protein